MAQQQRNPRRPVTTALLLVIMAMVVFGVAFYLFDGISYIRNYFGADASATSNPATVVVDAPANQLQLPVDMTEEFALRLWQEQLDSQTNITRLAEGDLKSIAISKVETSTDLAVLDITATFADGTSAPGKLGMRKVGDSWYFAYVTGTRPEETDGLADTVQAGEGEEPTSPLPYTADVDIPLLNTILSEQQKSASVLEEYASGNVQRVDVDRVVTGTATATLKITMLEMDETSHSDIVLIRKTVDDRERWFVARFSKSP